ncbi:hypothetical protein [Streptacidiphilus rugosus]|uniref:hypothetical protein n=1 Tax=Streptacidiphilus rugosus TaxID=405783 RepID=UPI00056B0D3A|nr:hypothetical protein [Streptacidiphilus rugosus]
MTWTDEIERAIVDDYLQLARCFPANDRGLEHFRALWLKAVTAHLPTSTMEPAGASSVPRPYDHFLSEYLVDHERGAGPPGSGPVGPRAAQRRAMQTPAPPRT